MFESDQDELLDRNVTVSSIARPTRVAYFVEDNSISGQILDEIFAECYGRWGGVDTLIVPFKNGRMRSAYWHWLLSFDPDYIYSYVKLSKQLIQKIHYKILPAYFETHSYEANSEGIVQRLNPHFNAKPLSSFSLVPFYSLRDTLLRNKIEAIIDAYPMWEDDGFIGDSFGIASRSQYNWGFPLKNNIEDYVGTYLLTPPDAPEDRWRYRISPNATEIVSVGDLLKQIASTGNVVSVAQLSNALIPGPHPRYDPRRSINIVIGDTFNDRVYFWNSRLLRQNHECDMHYGGLRIPERRLEDDEFIDALKEFLRWKYNFVGGDGSERQFTIRSLSLSVDKLRKHIGTLRNQTHLSVNYEKISSLDSIVPKSGQFPTYSYHSLGGKGRLNCLQDESRKSFHFKPSYPYHLSEISNIPPSLKTGVWYADAKITRHNNQSVCVNVTHWWKLPKRDEAVLLFVRIPSGDSRCEGRINNHGLLSLPCKQVGHNVTINIPEDEEVLGALIATPYPCSYNDARRNQIPHTAYRHIDLSEEGQYLNGALGLFGSLYDAWKSIEDRYWRNIFLELCDPKKVIETSFLQIKNKLKKRIAGRHATSVSISTEDDWDRITDAVIDAAFHVRNPRSFISYTRFQGLLDKELRDYFEKHPQSLHDGETIESVLENRVAYLSGHIQELCSDGIFTQGVVQLCKSCGNRNWFTIDELMQTLYCHVCKEPFNIPLDHGWDFMLNQFLATCFREHGTMPLIWALGEINWRSRENFLYLPPRELYDKYPDKSKARDGELDLVCISDGKFIIGEVKRSASDFKKKDLKKLVSTIKKVRPDIVILACFDHDPRKMNIHVERLINLIPTRFRMDCKVESLCPDKSIEEPSFI